jgi:hypothetical protein
MVKKFFFAAIFAASVWTVGAAVSESMNVAVAGETAAITATDVYDGTASVSIMNGNPTSGNYPGSFEIDDATGDIYGSFDIVNPNTGALIHEFIIDGNLSSGAVGVITLPNGSSLSFTAVFTGVSFSGNSVTFTCTATITSTGNLSVFTFNGTK